MMAEAFQTKQYKGSTPKSFGSKVSSICKKLVKRITRKWRKSKNDC
jgi:hypothetical protein